MPNNSSTGFSARLGRVPLKRKTGRAIRLAIAFAGAVIIATGCAAVKAPPPDGAAATPWSTAFRDAARSNSTPVELAYPMRFAWGEDTASMMSRHYNDSSSPAIDDREIYIGTTTGRVYAFNLYSGKTIWKLDAGSPVQSSPSIDDTELCVGTQGGLLRCVSRSTGEENWSYQARTEIATSPLMLDDIVVFASSDDRVYALDRATGKERWVYSHGTFRTVTPRASSSPAYSDGRVFVQFSDSTIASIDAADGTEVWSRRTNVNLTSAPAGRRTPLVADGRVYVITDPSTVTAFDAATGDIEEVFSAGANESEVIDFLTLPDGGLIVGTTTSTVIYSGGVPEEDYKVGAGKESVTISSISLFGDKLVVVSNYTTPRKFFKRTYAYVESWDLKTRELTELMKVKGGVSARPAAAGERLAVLSNKGDLYVLAPAEMPE